MFIAAAAPVKVATVLALITPVVLPLSVFSVATASVVSLSVTASLPKSLILEDVRTVFTSAAAPVIVVTAVAFTATVVFPSIVFKSPALTEESVMVIV